MVRIVFKSLAVCFVISGLIMYAAYLQTGRLWLPSFSTPTWIVDEPKMEPLEPPSKTTWRWRQNGSWHYSDEPRAGVNAERIDQQAASADKNS